MAYEGGALMFGSKIVSKIVISIFAPYSSDGFIKSAAPRTTGGRPVASRLPHPKSLKPNWSETVARLFLLSCRVARTLVPA